MKPHRRLRKTIKWGSLAAGVLLLAAWIGSVWYYAWWVGRWGVAVHVAGGRISFVDTRAAPRVQPGWTLHKRGDAGLFLWFGWGGAGSLPHLAVPLWIAAAPALLVTAAAWRRDTIVSRRDRLGCCVKCGYDRRGLAPDGVCPECGSPSP